MNTEKDQLLRLELLQKGSNMGIWDWNITTGEEWWSERFFTLLGYQPGEIPAKFETFLELLHPDDKEGVSIAIENHLKNNVKYDVQIRMRRKNGKYFWYRSQGQTSKDNNGTPVRMVGSLIDINELKRSEFEREVIRKNLAQFVKHSPAAIAMLDTDMDYLLVSDVWLTDYNLTENVVGKNHYEVFPEIGDEWKEHHRLVIEEGKTLRSDKDKFVRADGSVQYLQWELRPWYIGKKIGGIMMFTNLITDIVKKEETLKKKNTQLKALASKLTTQKNQLEDYAYITSHNLRSPVGNINALLNLYNSDPNAETLKFFIENLNTTTNNLNSTIDNLSELFTIKKNINKRKVTLDLEKNLKGVISSLSEEIKAKDAIVEYDFSKAKEVRFPKVYLESILLNLLTNALKYSSPDRKPHITFKSTPKKGYITLSCTDNGLGINLDRHKHKIFGLNKTFHRNADARGVGLFITKAQVEAMEGTVAVDSVEHEGSTFYINIKKI